MGLNGRDPLETIVKGVVLKEGIGTLAFAIGWQMLIEGIILWIELKINGVWMTEDQEEIYAVLMDMNDDKALGSDGFIVAFWQSSWELVKEEIMHLFREFYDQRSFAKTLDGTTTHSQI
ncbi:hypothetical protein CK203_035394 [Vitis vinifera]|uniref:Uncharacterized protein n=1 Tax=Vitis vinifera TaxID=29760 RepID=A0A438I3R8_VITVI|nr:hypothetical protein CK203_035394 [Vitis vinifera]